MGGWGGELRRCIVWGGGGCEQRGAVLSIEGGQGGMRLVEHTVLLWPRTGRGEVTRGEVPGGRQAPTPNLKADHHQR